MFAWNTICVVSGANSKYNGETRSATLYKTFFPEYFLLSTLHANLRLMNKKIG